MSVTDIDNRALCAEIEKGLPEPFKPAARGVAERVQEMVGRIPNTDQYDATNSLTYHVELVLGNSETTQNTLAAMASAHLSARDECPVCGGTGEGPIRATLIVHGALGLPCGYRTRGGPLASHRAATG